MNPRIHEAKENGGIQMEEQEKIPENIMRYFERHRELTNGISSSLFNFNDKLKQLQRLAHKITQTELEFLFEMKNDEIMPYRDRVVLRLKNMDGRAESSYLLDPFVEKYGSYLEQRIEDAVLDNNIEEVEEIIQELKKGRPRITISYCVINEIFGENVHSTEYGIHADNIPAILDQKEEFENNVEKAIDKWEKEMGDEHIKRAILEESYGYTIQPQAIAAVDIFGAGRIMYGVMQHLEDLFEDAMRHTPEISKETIEKWIIDHPKEYQKLKIDIAARHKDQKTLD
jgi:hypothetical protein